MVLLNEEPPFGKKCCVTHKIREEKSRKNPPTKQPENVIEKKSEAINMYERIEKCEVKGKDFLGKILKKSEGGRGGRKEDARKWKILMFNQLLMSEFNVVTQFLISRNIFAASHYVFRPTLFSNSREFE